MNEFEQIQLDTKALEQQRINNIIIRIHLSKLFIYSKTNYKLLNSSISEIPIPTYKTPKQPFKGVTTDELLHDMDIPNISIFSDSNKLNFSSNSDELEMLDINPEIPEFKLNFENKEKTSDEVQLSDIENVTLKSVNLKFENPEKVDLDV